MVTIHPFKNRAARAGMFEDFLPKDFFANLEVGMGRTYPQTNVIDTENSLRVELVAPGFQKEHFKVSIEKNVLNIEATVTEEKEESKEKYLRREFSSVGFKKSFSLPENLNTDAVQASYENGILKIEVAKMALPQGEKAKEIVIS